MKVVYIGPHKAVTVDRSRAERNGDPVEVDDEVGKALIERGDFVRDGGSAPPAPNKKVSSLASELGVDLAEVTGTGKDGRIVVADVRKAAKAMSSPPSDTGDQTAETGTGDSNGNPAGDDAQQTEKE